MYLSCTYTNIKCSPIYSPRCHLCWCPSSLRWSPDRLWTGDGWPDRCVYGWCPTCWEAPSPPSTCRTRSFSFSRIPCRLHMPLNEICARSLASCDKNYMIPLLQSICRLSRKNFIHVQRFNFKVLGTLQRGPLWIFVFCEMHWNFKHVIWPMIW